LLKQAALSEDFVDLGFDDVVFDRFGFALKLRISLDLFEGNGFFTSSLIAGTSLNST
jgi:hypothetical protein